MLDLRLIDEGLKGNHFADQVASGDKQQKVKRLVLLGVVSFQLRLAEVMDDVCEQGLC